MHHQTATVDRAAVYHLIGCVKRLIAIARAQGVQDDPDGSIQFTVDSAELAAASVHQQMVSPVERPAALCIIEGGQLQSVMTTGGLDVLVMDFLEDADSADDTTTAVRLLENDGTWRETDPAQVRLHGEGTPRREEVEIVRARIGEFKQSGGKVC